MTLVLAKAGASIATFVPPQCRTLSDVFTNLSFSDLTKLVLRNAARLNHYYILGSDFGNLPKSPPKCNADGEAQLLRTEELPGLYNRLPSLGADDKRELMSRILFFKNGLRNCYTTRVDGEIANIHWLIFPSENDVIQSGYGSRFLPLSADEVMIENTFTFPAHRGHGLMPFSAWQLLNKAKALGYKRAVTYIRKDRIISLNHFLHLGFSIKRIVREYKILGFTRRAL